MNIIYCNCGHTDGSGLVDFNSFDCISNGCGTAYGSDEHISFNDILSGYGYLNGNGYSPGDDDQFCIENYPPK